METARREVNSLQNRERRLTRGKVMRASIVELMLLWWSKYTLDRWIENPLYNWAPESYKKSASPGRTGFTPRWAECGNRETPCR